MSQQTDQFDRTDFSIASEPGIDIAVRHVRRTGDYTNGKPLILVHGGGPGGVASFDLPVPGYSVAEDLAAAGHDVYVMDVRGWGSSARPPELAQHAGANPPAVTYGEAGRDIGVVVAAVRERHHEAKVALLGWASGGHWVGAYATNEGENLNHLIVLNSLYGVDAPWSMRALFEAADRPGEFDRNAGAYGLRTGPSLLAAWDRTIPVEEKSEWRDPAVAEAYVREALASDPTSTDRDPPSLRIPSGFQRESYEMSRGHRYWQAANIRVPTLVLRGERDFWSRPEDLAAFERDLVNAPRLRVATIPDGTHYLFNDRPERGRSRFLAEVLAFLADDGRA